MTKMIAHASKQIGRTYTDDPTDGYVESSSARSVARQVVESIRTLDPAIAAVVSVNWTLSPEQVARLHAQIIDAILQHEENA